MRQNAITAPVASVESGPDGDYVYTIWTENVATRAAVLVAARQNGLAVFTKWVAPRERVVVNGQYNLANGVKVAIEPPPPAVLVAHPTPCGAWSLTPRARFQPCARRNQRSVAGDW